MAALPGLVACALLYHYGSLARKGWWLSSGGPTRQLLHHSRGGLAQPPLAARALRGLVLLYIGPCVPRGSVTPAPMLRSRFFLLGCLSTMGRLPARVGYPAEDLSSRTFSVPLYPSYEAYGDGAVSVVLRLLVTPRVLLLLWDKWQWWSHTPARCVSPAEFPMGGFRAAHVVGRLALGCTSSSCSVVPPACLCLSAGWLPPLRLPSASAKLSVRC